MKKITFFLILSLSILTLYSQTGTYTLSFSGKLQSSGATVALQKVNIINITRSVDTMITTSPFTFDLTYSTNGINDPLSGKKNFVLYPVFPNPFNNKAGFDIEINKESNLKISLYSISGKRLTGIERKCSSGTHHFSITTSEKGMLFLNVSDGENYGSLKLVNFSKSANAATEIVYDNYTAVERKYKSLKSSNPFSYAPGDQLQFVGYSSPYANSSIYGEPHGDTAYVFQFNNAFYRITGHQTLTSKPSFVDVMFSVEDQQYKGIDNLDNSNFKVSEDGIVVTASESFRYVMKVNTIPYKLKTVLMLDISNSVAGNLSQIKTAAIALINTIAPKQQFAVYTFSSNPTLIQDFTSDVALLTSKINSITIGFASTNLYGSFIQGVQKWNDSFSMDSIVQGFLVVFTDGDDTQGAYTLQQAVSARGSKKAYMVGLGTNLTPAFLNSLANPGPYNPVTDINQLQQTFQQIQQDILKYSNSFYWVNYMSPKRAGNHNLKIEINANQNTASDSYYQNSFSANGFTDVYSGIYLNTTASQLYGIDSVVINNSNPFDLKAVTYWADNPPTYSWSSNNTNIVTVTPDSLYFNRAKLNFPGINGGIAYVTVNDNANTFSKILKVIAYTPPVVSTNAISNINYTTATAGGNVIGSGGLQVTARGACWSTTSNPVVTGLHTTDSSGMGIFSSAITGLSPNTKYYVRAYATNSKGTAYGDTISFNTIPSVAPSVTTDSLKNITATTASCFGNVTNTGGATVSVRGVCWGTTSNPVATGLHATSGSGTGSYTCSITGLATGTTYYVRAYATNSVGTSYGTQLTFTTLPSVTTTAASNITSDSATAGGVVTSAGTATVTARGVCWSSTANPSITNAHTNNASGSGSFTSKLSGLASGTTYYIKAYATNSTGTAYGNELSFTTLATVTTTTASNVTTTTASCGGNVTSTGGAAITARGVCWSTSQNPLVTGSHTSDGTVAGIFTSNITALASGTTYYVRAYATNSTGTAYGNQISITTLPAVTTNSADSIFTTTARSGGTVTSAGGVTVTARGVCWSTSQPPSLANSFTSNGTGTGSFTSNLTALASGTTYYVMAYAKNITGTAYGNQISFTTLPAITTTAVSNVTYNTAKSGGNVTSIGGAAVTARGVCWSTSQNPLATGNHTTDSSGTGSFTSNITGLMGSTMYYVRAFATNASGTVYGNQLSFTTAAPIAASISTTAISNLTAVSATSGGNVSNDGGATVTARGVCWSTTPSPLATGNHSSNGTGTGSFISTISPLTTGTTYYVRAFATNSVGTSYGTELSFVTLSQPIVTTTAVSGTTSFSTTTGGNVSSDGGATVTARGVCWSTATNPTISNSLSNNGTGTGSFTSGINDLLGNTTYYVRAYATNVVNTSYGNQISFTTSAPVPSGVITTAVTNITGISATTGGNIVNNGGALVTARGVCWSTTSNPVVTGNHTSDGTGSGSFTSTISSLTAGTTYYVRAYATNSAGTAYGSNKSFTTPVIPTLAATTYATNITGSSATSGGNVTSDGGATITARGVCWSTTANPTVALTTKTTDGSGTGIFTSNITGLSGGTTYYVRAYATNVVGTSYGTQKSFTSLVIAPQTITTTVASNITNISAVSGGNIGSDGGATVTARGVCWSTSQNPTIANSKTTDGTGTGSYTSTISSLTSLTTYYIRAYATNSIGTSYGNQISFTTFPAIGQTYQGGIVAYILQPDDPGYSASVPHGLIAAPSDQSTGIRWYNGTYIITGATAIILGTGNANTNTIVSVQGAGNYAAKLCYDLVLNGYSDWYLPSFNELWKLYLNKITIGGFSNNLYWSSSENDLSGAAALNFSTEFVSNAAKILTLYVRAVRSF
jgi:hypothetical protein